MLLLWNTLVACAPKQAIAPPMGAEQLSADRLRAHVEHLSTDAFNGRDTGSPELARAAGYLADQLAACGLQPMPGDTDLFADYTLYRTGYDREQTRLSTTKTTQVELGRDWRPFPFSDPGEISGDVVFAGYGITAPEHDYDDYAGLDVEGRIVLLLRYEPGETDPESPFDGLDSSEHATFMRKARNAIEHGAIGYLLVTGPLYHTDSDDLRLGGRLSLEPPELEAGVSEGPQFQAGQISRQVAEALVAGSGQTLAELQTAVDAGTPPSELSIGPVQATLSVAIADEAEAVPERNVVAYLPGASAPDELVVVGAHYDHIGGYVGEGDTIFNGADDNASGTAGMLELACAFGSRAARPARSMVFMGYSGEEKGLLGSQAWVAEHGADDVVFMLNLDMIGRNPEEPIAVVGDGYGTGVDALVMKAVGQSGLQSVTLGGTDYAGNSDHDAFYREDVPFLFFFAGLHEDYHQVGDHADKLAYERMFQIVQTGYHLLEPIADGQATPAFIHHINWLGVEIQQGMVAAVVDGSRASEVGFAVGDRLAEVGETAVTGDTIGPALRDIEPGTVTSFVLQRDGDRVELDVERAKTGYLGIYPGAPSDEQQQALGIVDGSGVLVRQLAEEGPAAQSGLQAGDIILQLSGQPISTRTLSTILQRIGAGEPVQCLVARAGERITIELVLGERPQR